MEIIHEHPIYSSDEQKTEAIAEACERILEILENEDAD